MAVSDTLRNLLGYETFKVVKVTDLRLGILYRCFQVAIAIYILSEIFTKSLYLNKEPPVPGAVRITLQAPDNLVTPSYCNGTTPCTFWIQFPSDGAGVAFFTTRASVTNFPNQPGCNPFNVASPTSQCLVKTKNNPNNITVMPVSYIADIEDYTVMIEHSVRGSSTSIALRNGLMNGALCSPNGQNCKTVTNASRTAANPSADGDIYTIRDILAAAGADLDAPSTAPGANKAAGETYRSSGIVIVIIIEYQNVRFKLDQIEYKYLPQIIDGNEYKAVENVYNTTDGSYTVIDRHGIRLVFQQHGTIGQFGFVALLTNLVASFALFKLAELIVEIFMLRFHPDKREYEKAKYDDVDTVLEEKYKDGSVEKSKNSIDEPSDSRIA
ncbi:8174_t:CDS:10 [Cetraspora pellucida]|uniref:8174_t:CDS:1 n=1 Tax=Cetraspora pellucida TaxID=1433469 RepID=A0A9N9D8S7_9GLOM|nr:8174_t:CDS:10 [Cetraspora pellucida]